MKAVILNSNPGARFHIGRALGAFTEETHNTQKTTSEYLHSDTLWSALVNAWALSCPKSVNDFINECMNGNFRLSSAFYCYMPPLSTEGKKGGNKKIYFLPKPASLNLAKFSDPKSLKRVKFLSKGIWEKGLLPEDWFDKDKCTLLQNESVVALKSEIEVAESFKLFYIETTAKTSARDITDREDAFYFQTDLYLAENIRWYFLIDNKLPDTLLSDFHTAMKALINLGIGGERTTGCGSLSGYEEIEFNLEMEKSEHTSSISLIAPNQEELSENSLYQIIKRGGRFLEKGKSLPMVQMLLEGAVFDNNINGKIVELNNKPKILRYGLSFLIPLHNNFSNF